MSFSRCCRLKYYLKTRFIMGLYVLPLWYECRLVLGKPLSRLKMLSHRSEANKRRKDLGSGMFAWGPNVSSDDNTVFYFSCMDPLADHSSDFCSRKKIVQQGSLLVVMEPPRAVTSNSLDHNISQHDYCNGISGASARTAREQQVKTNRISVVSR